MSFSNLEVARRAVANHHKPVEGSNLRTVPRDPDHSQGSSRALRAAGFTPLQSVYSYYTEIARLVRNEHTGGTELWVDSWRYSNTTDRHMSYLLSAAHTVSDPARKPTIYPFSLNRCTIVHRCDWYPVRHAIETARAYIADAAAPRKHAQTRTNALSGAQRALSYAIERATKDVHPSTVACFPTTVGLLRDATHLRDLAQQWLALPMDEMRASLEAYIALNHGDKA